MRLMRPPRIVDMTAAVILRTLALAACLAASPAWSQGAPPPAAPGQPATGGLPALIPAPGDPANVDEVVLPAKPVVILSGASAWDEGLKNVRASFAHIRAEMAKTGLAPAGRPIAVFTQTTDESFKFDAMIPIAATPAPPPALGEGLRFGTTPSGKAYRFVHKGPYDDVDSTYETITTYLEVKDIVAKDVFIEEYLNDVAEADSPDLEVNIYVQPR